MQALYKALVTPKSNDLARHSADSSSSTEKEVERWEILYWHAKDKLGNRISQMLFASFFHDFFLKFCTFLKKIFLL